MRKLSRPTKRTNCNNKFDLFIILASLGINIYSLYLNELNVYYNKKNVEANEQIAQQLSTLNGSNFMYELNNKLN